jgi:hypothetical protein
MFGCNDQEIVCFDATLLPMLPCAVATSLPMLPCAVHPQVLLKASPESPLGLVAKLADFG